MNKTDFLSEVASGIIPPLSLEIPFREPWEIYELLCCQPPSILMESVKGPEKIARYSFIAWEPYLRCVVKDGEVLVGRGKGKDTISFRPPLERLQELVAAYPQRPDPELPPFQGGAAGLLCYDFVRYIERLPSAALDDLQSKAIGRLRIDDAAVTLLPGIGHADQVGRSIVGDDIDHRDLKDLA
ncbi:MAG: hypothetical protein HGA78_02365, partial [Nitrospirales bacterium]|nr:hypothetical protein [Nitrospirales bacterium]